MIRLGTWNDDIVYRTTRKFQGLRCRRRAYYQQKGDLGGSVKLKIELRTKVKGSKLLLGTRQLKPRTGWFR